MLSSNGVWLNNKRSTLGSERVKYPRENRVFTVSDVSRRLFEYNEAIRSIYESPQVSKIVPVHWVLESLIFRFCIPMPDSRLSNRRMACTNIFVPTPGILCVYSTLWVIRVLSIIYFNSAAASLITVTGGNYWRIHFCQIELAEPMINQSLCAREKRRDVFNEFGSS